MDIDRELLSTLQAHLRRDPNDRDVGLLISLTVRDPFVLYESERRLLGRMLHRGGNDRARVIADAAAQLLRRG